MSVIVIRLHPAEPTTGAAFAGYLDNLKIEVSDRSFGDPSGKDPGHLLGSAEYLIADPTSTIVQHEEPPPVPGPTAVATAAIEIADPLPFAEYLAPDLVLKVTRGTQRILVKDLNFNVDVAVGSLPAVNSPANYEALGPTALYLGLPKPLVGLAPGTAYLDVPTDGTGLSYDAVLSAMQTVLAADPGGAGPDLAALTPAQCRHLAWEIVSNRALDPLPDPGQPLQNLYRLPGADDGARRQFESNLMTYYAVRATKADVLAKFVYSVSAALACQAVTQSATQVGLSLPVFPGLSLGGGNVPTVPVVVSQ